MLTDSIGVRVKDNGQIKNLKAQDILDFIEALSVGNKENRAMSSYLAKILKNSKHVSQHPDIPLFALAYLSDFNLKVSDGLHAVLL